MRKNSYYKIIQGLMLVGILFSLLSCGVDRSIFWTIANSREEEDYSLDNTLSITAMTDDDSNYYISASGSIWWQEMSLEDNVWDKIKFPKNAILCTALEYYNSLLYAAFIFKNGDAGIYTTTNPTNDSPDWTSVVDPLIENKQIIRFMEVNSLLFISLLEPPQEEEFTYSLYYYDGTDFYFIHDNITDKSKPIKDIDWNGTIYWTVVGSSLYELNASLNNATKITSIEPEGKLGGILYQTSSGRFYISSEKGNIYIYDGSNWDFLDDEDIKKVEGKIVAFTDLLKVNGNIVIGTQGYGFYEMKNGSLENLVRAGENDNMDSILSSDLYTSHILSLYKTPTDLVFFCTGGDGLYHNTYDGDKWSEDWVRE